MQQQRFLLLLFSKLYTVRIAIAYSPFSSLSVCVCVCVWASNFVLQLRKQNGLSNVCRMKYRIQWKSDSDVCDSHYSNNRLLDKTLFKLYSEVTNRPLNNSVKTTLPYLRE